MFRRRHRGTLDRGERVAPSDGVSGRSEGFRIDDMSDHYLEVISLVERLHRQFHQTPFALSLELSSSAGIRVHFVSLVISDYHRTRGAQFKAATRRIGRQ